MNILVKILAVALVVGGLWIWVTGRVVPTPSAEIVVPTTTLSASAILAPSPAAGVFDREGTIVLDMSQGGTGVPFILYTEYSEQGKPSIRTKRLVFTNQAICGEKNLPCATNQPGAPVHADEKVRIIGEQKDETVIVSSFERLS